MPRYASFWTRHDGSECPIEPFERVQYKTRDKKIHTPVSGVDAARLKWRWLSFDNPEPDEIIAFRLADPTP